jgi:hypothetical protein
MTPLKPDTVEKTLREKPYLYIWYQVTLNVHDTMFMGPFDFIYGYKVPRHACTTQESPWKKGERLRCRKNHPAIAS